MSSNSQIEHDTPIHELECPTRWPFDLSWENEVDQTIGWNNVQSLCGVSRAASEIKDHLTYDGVRAFEKVIIQNNLVLKISEGRLNFESTTRLDVDWQSGNTWERHLDKANLVRRAYNTDLAPPPIKESLDYLWNFIRRGNEHAQALIQLIENRLSEIQTRKSTEAEEQMRAMRLARLGKWHQVDVDHSSVKVGFIYVLENPLMSGVFKIGFTASNPDKRAHQISEQYNLPASFSVTAYWRTKDPYIVEQRIHQQLEAYRRGGEFFAATIEIITQTITSNLID